MISIQTIEFAKKSRTVSREEIAMLSEIQVEIKFNFNKSGLPGTDKHTEKIWQRWNEKINRCKTHSSFHSCSPSFCLHSNLYNFCIYKMVRKLKKCRFKYIHSKVFPSSNYKYFYFHYFGNIFVTS